MFGEGNVNEKVRNRRIIYSNKFGEFISKVLLFFVGFKGSFYIVM